MSKIEIDIIISNIGKIREEGLLIPLENLDIHESGNVHLTLIAHESKKTKKSHIVWYNKTFMGSANVIESYEENNCIELPPDSTIDSLPF